MHGLATQSEAPIAVHTDLHAIFVSLELSRSTWLLTSVSPGAGERMSKRSVSASDTAGLFSRFAELQQRARTRTGRTFSIITIQEAGLDGFWIHRLLQ
jgi:transposase